MIAAAAGIALGLLIAFGPLSFLSEPVDSLNESIVNGGYNALEWIFSFSGFDQVPHPVMEVTQIVFSTALPGLAALALVVAAKAANKIRRMVSIIVLVCAFSSFLYLPGAQAVALSIGALIVVGIMSVGKGAFVTVPLIVLATLIGVRYGMAIWGGGMSSIGRGAINISEMTQSNDLELWRAILMIVGIAPFVYAIKTALDEK